MELALPLSKKKKQTFYCCSSLLIIHTHPVKATVKSSRDEGGEGFSCYFYISALRRSTVTENTVFPFPSAPSPKLSLNGGARDGVQTVYFSLRRIIQTAHSSKHSAFITAWQAGTHAHTFFFFSLASSRADADPSQCRLV